MDHSIGLPASRAAWEAQASDALFVSMPDAAQALGVSVRTLYRWKDRGYITTIKHPFSGRVVVARAELARVKKQIGDGVEVGGTND